MDGGCYNRRVLHVDLSMGKTRVETPPDSFYRAYGGGSAMGALYLIKEMPAGVDPFSPQNLLTLFLGVPTGLPISGQSRLTATAKSPLTGGIGDSQCGGFFPAKLKQAGFDGIVIHGAAQKPVYLWIHDGQAELRDAGHLWGKVTGEVDQLIKNELGDQGIEILQIGPAGEKLARLAAIMNMCNRANGRTGMGAVMGSKRLKAIAVQGKEKVKAYDLATIARLNRKGAQDLKTNPDMEGMPKYGTAGAVSYQNSIGSLPTFNYTAGQFDTFDKITGETMADTILKGNDTCFACTLRCKRVVEAEYRERKIDPLYGGPEYETLGTFGSYCGIDNLEAISLANQLCNEYGLDTIGTGATIAFAMECFEHGLISSEDTGGIELRFGNPDAMLSMLEQICHREGFGEILGEGSARAAKIIGKGAEEFLVTVKDTELPAHMPQAKKSLAVIYSVNPFGADHQSSEHDPMYEEGISDGILRKLGAIGLHRPQKPGSLTNEKVRFAYLTQVFYSALDSYSLCQFVWGPSWQMFGPVEMVEMLRAATGWDVTVEEIMRVGERRLNLLRAFNAREGFTREADRLPSKFTKPLQGKGPTAGIAIDLKHMDCVLDEYYALAGWDMATGNPTHEKLADLGLSWIR